MQRTIAMLLATFFSLLLMLPLFVPAQASIVPECCRKSGKHQCVMHANLAEHAAGSGISSVGARCPYNVHGMFSSNGHAGTPILTASVCVGLIAQLTDAAEAAAGYRISRHRSDQKRGPPNSILF